MTSRDVIDLYHEAETAGIRFWIDGGWAVDALLGEPTRPHADLDIALKDKDVPKLRELLGSKGYREIRRDSKWNFVLGDPQGREVDLHSFNYDDRGNIVKGILYPVESLTGTGRIEGREVRCISLEYLIKFHSGYELRERDYRDVAALCGRFGVELPAGYRHLRIDAEKLIRTQMDLECIGIREDGRLHRIEGPDPDGIARVYLHRSATGREFLYFREDVTEEVVNRIRQMPFAELFRDGGPLLRLTDGKEGYRYRTYLLPENMDGGAGNAVIREGPNLRAEIMDQGRVVAYCESARENESSAEAWVFVDEEYRCQGLARDAVTAWAAGIHKRGKIAFYSHGTDNVASAALARKLQLGMVFETLIITG